MVRTMLVAAACVGVAVGGCVDMQEVRAVRDEAAQLRDDLRARAGEWERREAALPAGSPSRAVARAAGSLARAKEAAVGAAVSAADEALARANNQDDPLSGGARGVGGVAPLLPEPVRVPVLLGAGLVAALLRASALKRGLASVASGLEKAMEEDARFRERFKAHANTFRAVQTRTAKRVVDEVTGEGRIRLPV